MQIGQPPQVVEMDLNMLASDFYVIITTSRKGSRYDELFSQTGGDYEHKEHKFLLTLESQSNPMNSHFLVVALRVIFSICQQSMSRFLFHLHTADLRSSLLPRLDPLAAY